MTSGLPVLALDVVRNTVPVMQASACLQCISSSILSALIICGSECRSELSCELCLQGAGGACAGRGPIWLSKAGDS